MTVNSHRSIREIDKKQFRNFIKHKIIIITNHARFHIGSEQRKIFKEQDLINLITYGSARKVYLQANGRYALFFRKSDGYHKVIIELNNTVIYVVSIMYTQELPKLHL